MLCLRIDLDYVPWDSPDAAEFGHGEPAMLLRILELARSSGLRFHFFASERVLHAFPASADAVLDEGHDLDWFCKHPENGKPRQQEAMDLFKAIGHTPIGLSIRGPWPDDADIDLATTRFISATSGNPPAPTRLFPVETKTDRDALRAGLSARTWTDGIKAHIRDAATRNIPVTVAVRPQVLAKYDPALSHIQEILDIAQAVDMPLGTLRQALT